MAQSAVVSKAEREADLKDIDIDDVRPIETDSAGQTVRVVYKAAPNEVDEVGFEVTRPPGPMGEQMFQEQLSNGFTELRNYINGIDSDSGDDTPTSERGDVETDEQRQSPTDTADADEVPDRAEPSEQALSPPATDTVVSEQQITVDLEAHVTENDREALREQLEAVADDMGVSADTADRVDALEDRVAELESQIEAFQNGLSQVVSPETDE